VRNFFAAQSSRTLASAKSPRRVESGSGTPDKPNKRAARKPVITAAIVELFTPNLQFAQVFADHFQAGDLAVLIAHMVLVGAAVINDLSKPAWVFE
jgi:hypothetical protein